MIKTFDAYCILVTDVLKTINLMWIEEIDTTGKSFDYNSQDIYKENLNFLYNSDFEKKINFDENNDKIQNLKTVLEECIITYNKYKNIYNGLDRKQIAIDKYRELIAYNTGINDNDLFYRLIYQVEIQDRKNYYTSSFYNDVGFLLENYHEKIFYFCTSLLKDLLDNFNHYYKYNKNYIYNNDIPFFSMKMVGDIYEEFSDIFEKISELDFYRELQFFNIIPKIKDLEGYKYKYFYLIHKLSCILPKKKKLWLNSFLKEHQIEESIFKSKYRFIVSKDSTTDGKEFAEKVDNFFKKYESKKLT